MDYGKCMDWVVDCLGNEKIAKWSLSYAYQQQTFIYDQPDKFHSFLSPPIVSAPNIGRLLKHEMKLGWLIIHWISVFEKSTFFLLHIFTLIVAKYWFIGFSPLSSRDLLSTVVIILRVCTEKYHPLRIDRSILPRLFVSLSCQPIFLSGMARRRGGSVECSLFSLPKLFWYKN